MAFHSGVLLITRWPPDTSREFAPDVVRQMWPRDSETSMEVLSLRPEGSWKNERLEMPSNSTSVLLLHSDRLTPDAFEALQRQLGSEPVLCRYDFGATPRSKQDPPRSVIAFMPEASLPDLQCAKPYTLASLQDAGELAILQRMHECLVVWRERMTGAKLKKYRHAANTAVDETKNAIHWIKNSGEKRNALGRVAGATRAVDDFFSRMDPSGCGTSVCLEAGQLAKPSPTWTLFTKCISVPIGRIPASVVWPGRCPHMVLGGLTWEV